MYMDSVHSQKSVGYGTARITGCGHQNIGPFAAVFLRKITK